MRQILASIALPAIFGLVLDIPFMILEYVNRQHVGEPYPVALFVLLFLLGTAFAYTARPIIRDVTPSPALFLRIGLLLVITWLWISALADHMPCFLGLPTCR